MISEAYFDGKKKFEIFDLEFDATRQGQGLAQASRVSLRLTNGMVYG